MALFGTRIRSCMLPCLRRRQMRTYLKSGLEGVCIHWSICTHTQFGFSCGFMATEKKSNDNKAKVKTKTKKYKKNKKGNESCLLFVVRFSFYTRDRTQGCAKETIVNYIDVEVRWVVILCYTLCYPSNHLSI